MRAASVPGRVTLAAIDGAKTVATWSWGISQILLQNVTVKEQIQLPIQYKYVIIGKFN